MKMFPSCYEHSGWGRISPLAMNIQGERISPLAMNIQGGISPLAMNIQGRGDNFPSCYEHSGWGG